MIDELTRYVRSGKENFIFSIVIPTWNNLKYLKNCIDSILTNSSMTHQLILFVNEGSDGTLKWLQELQNDGLDFIHSSDNLGICYGVNLCRPLVKSDHIVYMNDDMFVLPGWDEDLYKTIEGLDTTLFMLSSTLIEPTDTGNNCVVVKDFGEDLDSFQRDALLLEYQKLKRSNWQGSTWPPTVIHKEAWDLVGGYSTEFSPGMYSDPDLSFKLLMAGAREFIGIGSSLVYHFGSKSTKRVKKNQGRRTFLHKWGISSRVFRKEMLKMGQAYQGPLPNPDLKMRNRLVHRIKRAMYS